MPLRGRAPVSLSPSKGKLDTGWNFGGRQTSPRLPLDTVISNLTADREVCRPQKSRRPFRHRPDREVSDYQVRRNPPFLLRHARERGHPGTVSEERQR